MERVSKGAGLLRFVVSSAPFDTTFTSFRSTQDAGRLITHNPLESKMNKPHLLKMNWQSHLVALMAIAKKDWLYFIRYPLNAIFRVVEPVMWLTPVYFLGQSFSTAGGNEGFAAYSGTQDYMSFILLGAVLSSYVADVFW